MGLLKSLGFLDESGVPTQRYYSFLDQSESKTILADAIRESYSDLFNVKKDAYNLSVDEVKNKLRTLTQGKKSEQVLTWMSNTFKALSDIADWKENPKKNILKEKDNLPQEKLKEQELVSKSFEENKITPSLNYNIQIHLPATRDVAIYDSLFKSLKEHLLK